jgi:hypothetical protein
MKASILFSLSTLVVGAFAQGVFKIEDFSMCHGNAV